MTTPPTWHDRAAALALDGRAFINGQRVASASGETFDKHSPIDGRRLGAIARGQAADIDAAVLAARAAFGQVAAVPDAEELRRPFGADDISNFRTPPRINYPQTWFHFIGGNVSAEGITEDLEAIAGAGIAYKSWLDVAQDVTAGRLKVLLPELTCERAPLNLLCGHRAQLSKPVKLLRDMLIERCAGLAGQRSAL